MEINLLVLSLAVELIPVREDHHPADPPFRRRPTPPNSLHLEALRRGDIELERVTVGSRRPLHPSQHLDPSPPPPGRSYPPVPQRMGLSRSPPVQPGHPEYLPGGGPPPNREIPRGAVLIPPSGHHQDRRRGYSPPPASLPPGALPPVSQGLPTATFHHRPPAQNGVHPSPPPPARENGHAPGGILSLGEHAPRPYGQAPRGLQISPPSLPPHQGRPLPMQLPLPGPSHTITSNGGHQYDERAPHRISLPQRPPAGSLHPHVPGLSLPIAGMPKHLLEIRQEFAPPSPPREYAVCSPSNSSSSGTPASGSVNSFQEDGAHRSPGGGSITPGSVGQGLFPTPPPSSVGGERRGGRPATRLVTFIKFENRYFFQGAYVRNGASFLLHISEGTFFKLL